MTAIDTLIPIDLSNIKSRLINKIECGEDLAEKICNEYKRFLNIHKTYPNEYIVPGHLVDEVWHDHILHTKKYQKDCMQLFGAYLHHQPSENGNDCDIKPTLDLYLRLYGFDAPQEIWLGATKCMNGCGGRCGGKCIRA